MKNLKIFLALLLALAMVVSMAACGGNNAGKETDPPKGTDAPAGNDDTAGADDTTAAAPDDSKDLSWLNLGGTYPIVAEGTEKTLSMVLPIQDDTVDTYMDRFQYIFAVEQMNINLDVQAVPSSAWGEKLPLILADTENLPDLIMNTGWGTGELLRYGAEEGLIIDLAPYINENYMPCLSSLFTDHPEYKTPWTDAEGRVWGVGFIGHIDRPDERQWHYLNYDWMEDCGLNPAEDLPETLDEFTDLMRLFKEKKSAELGKEIYPISGMYTGWNSIVRYLLLALGYAGSNYGDGFPGGDINMKDGKVVLPCADREGWEGFIKTMKTWYDEGLVHPEYFTADSKAMDALISAGETGFVTVPPFIWVGSEPDRLGAWWAAPPLTSEWSEKPQIVSNAIVNGGPRHVITTACDELELALAFYDFFFQRGESTSQQNYFLLTHGVYEENTELAEKYPQFVFAKEAGYSGYEHLYDKEKYIDANDVLTKEINLWGNVAIGYSCVEDENGVPQVEGTEEALALYAKYDGTGVKAWVEVDRETRAKYIQGLSPRTVNAQYRIDVSGEFPTTLYFDAETQELVDDYKVLFKEFVNTESARFITGERPLEELPDYFDELDALGAQEYIKIHQDYFDTVMG